MADPDEVWNVWIAINNNHQQGPSGLQLPAALAADDDNDTGPAFEAPQAGDEQAVEKIAQEEVSYWLCIFLYLQINLAQDDHQK